MSPSLYLTIHCLGVLIEFQSVSQSIWEGEGAEFMVGLVFHRANLKFGLLLLCWGKVISLRWG